MKSFSIFFLIINLSQLIFSQTLLHPAFPSQPINDAHYINDSEVIFVNSSGCIYKSYDGGSTWELKKFYQNSYLSEIGFINDITGFVRIANTEPGFLGLIFTQDGGETWEDRPLSIFPTDTYLPITESLILKTTNEGEIQRLDNFFDAWDTTFKVPTFIDSGYDYINIIPYGSIKKLIKLNDNKLMALCTNENAFSFRLIQDSLSYILTSTDLGLSWDTTWIGLKHIINDIVFTDDSTSWMISDSLLFKSTNGGVSWNLQPAYYDGHFYRNLLTEGEQIYLLTNTNSFVKSTDLGDTWSNVVLDFPGFLWSMVFNGNSGFIFGETLFKTSDTGETWENLNQYTRNDIYDLDFISTKEGLAFGNKGVYKTYDGGSTWSLKFTPKDLLYFEPGSLEMVTDSLGLLVAYQNIYKTTNGGESWDSIAFDEQRIIFSRMSFYDENLGIITGSTESNPGSHIFNINNIYITTNGGESWSKEPLDSLTFRKMKFTDPAHLWGITNEDLWLSKDSAKTWERVFEGRYPFFFTFDFYDSLYGVIMNSYALSYFTTDGGVSWNEFISTLHSSLADCRILGPYISGSQRILEAGFDGRLKITYIYPSGEIESNYQLLSYTNSSLHKIEVLVKDDFPYVWVAGNGFHILLNQFEKILDVNQNNRPLKTFFSLFQNYPNPFNPSTTIRYQIPQRGFVSLEIYNLLGEEIKTLVNEEQSAGTYNIEFNGETLSSGIYFYTLKSGNFIETKKFILLK
ncbi:MAG: T9SS type A sorting domain-containing protein [Ignavibacteria bacterium]